MNLDAKAISYQFQWSATGKHMKKQSIFIAFLAVFTSGMLLAQETNLPPTAKVLLAGIGTPPSQCQIVLDGLNDFLTENKVSTKQVETDGKSRTAVVEKIKTLGAESLLYITLDIAERQADNLTVQCFDSDGKKLWEEDTKGSLLAGSISGQTKTMLKKIQKKLEAHIGKSGLPVGSKPQ